MKRWHEFQAAEPNRAEVLRTLLGANPVAYLATVRRDGSPRVHPVCPILTDTGLYIAVAGSGRDQPSPKRFDLRNDGRYALHAMPGPRDDEFYATGLARLITDARERASVGAAAGHTVHGADDVFELLLQYVMTAHWERLGQPDTFAVRESWRATAG